MTFDTARKRSTVNKNSDLNINRENILSIFVKVEYQVLG